jgi:hypothetical protein
MCLEEHRAEYTYMLLGRDGKPTKIQKIIGLKSLPAIVESVSVPCPFVILPLPENGVAYVSARLNE